MAEKQRDSPLFCMRKSGVKNGIRIGYIQREESVVGGFEIKNSGRYLLSDANFHYLRVVVKYFNKNHYD